MQAIWYERNGAARDVLQRSEMDTPAPAAGEVLVRIAWSGINPSDVKRRDGWNGQVIAFPRVIPNQDGAGVIESVGEGVPASRVGERVWLHSTGWKRPFGTLAEYATTPAIRATRLPDSVPLQVGAALGVPAMTAHRAVFGCGPVNDKCVLVTGGAGAVGFYAIQLARWGGARVIATVSSADKAAQARRAGAEHVVDYRQEDVAARVLELTGGAGVDHIVEVDFAANLPVALKVLKGNGSIATYASMSQPQPAIPFYALMTKNVRLLWVFIYETAGDALAEAARDIGLWLASGAAVHPHFHVFTLDQAAAAHEAVEAGAVGKVLVSVSPEPGTPTSGRP